MENADVLGVARNHDGSPCGQLSISSTAPLMALSSAERRDFERCERIIAAGWQTFVEVGQALSAIRTQRLYREEHRTFEAYCQERWQYKRSYAYYLISAAQVVACLSTIVDIPTPSCEGQVRPLLGLHPDQIKETWTKACAAAPSGRVTARLVSRLAAAYRPKNGSRCKRFNRAGNGHPEKSKAGCLAEALECLKALETDIREGEANMASLAYIAELRRLLRELARSDHNHGRRP